MLIIESTAGVPAASATRRTSTNINMFAFCHQSNATCHVDNTKCHQVSSSCVHLLLLLLLMLRGASRQADSFFPEALSSPFAMRACSNSSSASFRRPAMPGAQLIGFGWIQTETVICCHNQQCTSTVSTESTEMLCEFG